MCLHGKFAANKTLTTTAGLSRLAKSALQMPVKTSTDETGHVGRRIGPYTATSIVVANMIGAGIFTTSGIVAAQVPGAGWVIVCYLLGGMIALSAIAALRPEALYGRREEMLDAIRGGSTITRDRGMMA